MHVRSGEIVSTVELGAQKRGLDERPRLRRQNDISGLASVDSTLELLERLAGDQELPSTIDATDVNARQLTGADANMARQRQVLLLIDTVPLLQIERTLNRSTDALRS